MYRVFEEIPAARDAIQRTFVRLYTKMPYDKITIRQLCAEAPIARTTFYFHYNNLGEVREDIESILLRGLLEIAEDTANGNYTTMDFRKFVLDTIDFIADNRDYFYAFLVAQPDPAFLDKWKVEIKNHFRLEYPNLQTRTNYALYAEVFANAILTCYSFWLNDPESFDFEVANQDVLAMIGML